MRFSIPLLTVVGTAAGAVAAVVAFQAGAGGATVTGPATKKHPVAPSQVASAPVASAPVASAGRS